MDFQMGGVNENVNRILKGLGFFSVYVLGFYLVTMLLGAASINPAAVLSNMSLANILGNVVGAWVTSVASISIMKLKLL